MLYRILMPIEWDDGDRLSIGDITNLKRMAAKTRAVFLAKGFVAEVVPPPLAVLPGFAEQAKAYAERIPPVLDVNDLEASDAPEEDKEFAMQFIKPRPESDNPEIVYVPPDEEEDAETVDLE